MQNPKPYQKRVRESGMLNSKAIIVDLMYITNDAYKTPYQVLFFQKHIKCFNEYTFIYVIINQKLTSPKYS